MILGNTIEFPHMTLRLVPKVFDTIDMVVFVYKEFGMVDVVVLEVGYIEHIIATPAVRIYDATRYNFVLNDRY